MKNNLEHEYKKYIGCLESYCSILSFDQIPKAGDLVFHRIYLDSIYLPLDIVERSWIGDFSSNEIFDMSKEKTDEWLRILDEHIALLEAEEEALKNKTTFGNEEDTNISDSYSKNDEFEEDTLRRVIIAEPGSGKTTFCKRVCMAYINKDEKIHKKYKLPEKGFPVLLLCRKIGDNYKQYTDFYQLAHNMTTNTFPKFNITDKTFKKMLQKKEQDGELLLLIDGLDELLEEEKTKYFSEKLCEYIKQNEEKNKIKVILTVRGASWVPETENDIRNILNPTEYTISRLTDSQVREFCNKWYAAVFPNNLEKQKNAEVVYEQLINPSHGFGFLNTLRTNPLHLSNLLIVSRFSGKIPSTKNKLYEEYLDLILAWNTRFNADDIKIQLAYVASYMTKNNLSRIDEKTLIEVLKKCYEDLEGKFSTTMNPEDIKMVLREFEERNCVLHRSTINSPFEFTHRQLQEYLTMYAIIKGYSDEIDNTKYPIEILKQHYGQKEWREIIEMSALTNDSRLTYTLVTDVISEIENNNKNNVDSYHLTNMAFNWIVNGIKIDKSKRELIYNVVFEEHITDVQINDIVSLLLKVDIPTGREFKEYIESEYSKTFNSTDKFGYAYSVIKAHQLYLEGLNPMKMAEEMIQKSNEFEQHVAMNIFIIFSWCKYENIRNLFRQYFLDFELSKETLRSLVDLAFSITGERKNLAIDAIQELSYAGYIKDDVFQECVDIKHLIKIISDSEEEPLKHKSAEAILSVYPMQTEILSDICPKDVKNYYLGRLEQQLEKLLNKKKGEKEEDDSSIVLTLNICATIGCWKDINEIKDNFDRLKTIYWCISSETKHRKLYRRIETFLEEHCSRNEEEPIATQDIFAESPFAYYSKGEFEKAKELFIMQTRTFSSAYNNLAYMLRRHEISCVKIDERSWSVEELLQKCPQDDYFVIINNALLVSGTYCNIVGEYKNGLDFIREYNNKKNISSLNCTDAISWWESLAKQGETEGLIVLAWLLELGTIETTKLGDLYQIKVLLKEKGIEI